MKPLAVWFPIFLLTFLSACSSSNSTTDLTLPLLVYQHPLPAFPKPLTASTMRVPLEIHVSKEGTVTSVQLLSGSGIAEWDSAAAAAIMKWRYTPARAADRPIGLWLRQTAVVRFSDPKYMILAEIVCNCKERVDSAYQLLISGGTFAEAAQRFSGADSRTTGGRLGTVNIQIYPEAVKNRISGLEKNEFTPPIPYGDRFAIFMRLPE
jgi:TonB family protein